DSITDTLEEGSAYTTEQKAIEGYTFSEVNGDAVSGTMDADKKVTYVYTKDAPPPPPAPVYYNLVVNYVDEAGEALADSITDTLEEGSAYTTEQKAIEGYTFSEVNGDAVSGTMDADKEVTYVYTKDAPPAPPTPPTPPPSIVSVYDLVVKWKTDEGRTLAPSTHQLKGENVEYTTEQKEFAGFEFVRVDGDPASGIMDGNKEVVYIYKAIPVEPTPVEPTPVEPTPVDIPEEDVPLAPEPPVEPTPVEPEPVDIPEEDIPLAEVPYTGDPIALYAVAATVSGLALLGLRKKEDEE
ncbi:MAG: MucBP domain-containing protein, partial [Firmicutes bacterium]|nr:MucBP domain-containing protein [Bacillota bacterium]